MMLKSIHMSVPSKEVLMQVSQHAPRFKRAITSVINNDVTHEMDRAYVTAILGSLSKEVADTLFEIGIQVPTPQTLIAIAINEGTAFYKNVRIAKTGGHDGAIAREYLLRTISVTSNGTPEIGNNMEYSANQPTSTKVLTKGQCEPQRHEEAHTEVLRDFSSTAVYGGSAAICFAASRARNEGAFTINIDGALCKEGKQRDFDWKNKITIQLTVPELTALLAVLMGWMPSLPSNVAKGHGAANDKWFTIEQQSDKFFMSIHKKGEAPRGVPIHAVELLPIISLITRQLQKNSEHLSIEQILRVAKTVADMCLKKSHNSK